MKNAILIKNATCHGQGSDRYKWISGITKSVMDEIAKYPGCSVLVRSHTTYMGQQYKLAIHNTFGWNHRQINDNDYEIIATI